MIAKLEHVHGLQYLLRLQRVKQKLIKIKNGVRLNPPEVTVSAKEPLFRMDIETEFQLQPSSSTEALPMIRVQVPISVGLGQYLD